MKNAFLVFGLMIWSSFSIAQIIDIPDVNFKNALVNSKCVDIDEDGNGDEDADVNNDKKISVDEALNVKSLIVQSQSISSISGIEFFTALKTLKVDHNQLSSLNVSNLTTLQFLSCYNNLLNTLNINNLLDLQKIYCGNNNLTSLDVSNLTSITQLWCEGNLISSLDVSNLSALQNLNCGQNNLTSLNISNLPALVNLHCPNNELTTLDLSNLKSLNNLNCASNKLILLDVSNLPILNKLNCSYNQLTSLTTLNLPSLTELNCSNNKLSTLNASHLTTLVKLYCDKNQLTSLEVSKLTSLFTLECSFNKLTFLSLSNCNYLSFLKCGDNQITTLDVSNLSRLSTLYCEKNQITSLDVSNLSSLDVLHCNHNKLSILNLKNGIALSPIYSLIFNNNPTLTYLCCDEINLSFLLEKLKAYGNTNAEVNTYCSFTPGGKYYSLVGKTNIDINKNGCNELDVIYPKISLLINDGQNKGKIISNTSGSYFITLQKGTYSIKPIPEHSDYFNVYPDSITVTFPSTSDTIIQNFCITSNGIFKQVDLSIIPLSPPARPGFNAQYKVVMTNKGNQVENGTLYFAYDEAKMDFVSTDVNPSAQSDGLLSWNFTDLLPFETRYHNVTLNVNSPNETPPVNGGDELLITCNILDNVFLLKQEVVGSYDPNDKTCLEGKTITPEQVGEYVHYLIRFENTGNYAAENVVVKDVIDESTFDIYTLQITDASHEAWARINGNIVEFIFENIQLPFDDATNDGYICFKIKTKPTLVLGNELKNEANIYFDYNLPILTNKTNTVVANLVATDEVTGKSSIEVFPNPVSDVLKFSGDCKIFKVEIFDMSGRLVQVSSVVDGEVKVEGLLSGAYHLKVYTQIGVMNTKMVKI